MPTTAPNYVKDVMDFHEKFHICYNGKPRQKLPMSLRSFRKNRLVEEVEEYVHAVQTMDPESQLDALVDLVYIALGTAQCHGWDFDEAWRRVHEANMKKERATDGNPGKPYAVRDEHTCDIVKPKGWVPPSMADLVGKI